MRPKPIVYRIGPKPYPWAVDAEVGYSGNYENQTWFFPTWREAYDWALNRQVQERAKHLISNRMTFCKCGWCAAMCHCGLGSVNGCRTQAWGCGPLGDDMPGGGSL